MAQVLAFKPPKWGKAQQAEATISFAELLLAAEKQWGKVQYSWISGLNGLTFVVRISSEDYFAEVRQNFGHNDMLSQGEQFATRSLLTCVEELKQGLRKEFDYDEDDGPNAA